jgi:hypothetical protein
MAGILDEVMEGISAKGSGAGAPPAKTETTPPKGDGGGSGETPPASDKKGAFEYGNDFKEKYGERKA